MLASNCFSMEAETRTFTPMLCLNFEITKQKLSTPGLRSQSWMQEGQQAVSHYIGLGPRFARPRPRYSWQTTWLALAKLLQHLTETLTGDLSGSWKNIWQTTWLALTRLLRHLAENLTRDLAGGWKGGWQTTWLALARLLQHLAEILTGDLAGSWKNSWHTTWRALVKLLQHLAEPLTKIWLAAGRTERGIWQTIWHETGLGFASPDGTLVYFCCVFDALELHFQVCAQTNCQKAPNGSSEVPKCTQNGPKGVPKGVPRRFQGVPKRPQVALREARGIPKSSKRCPKQSPRLPK